MGVILKGLAACVSGEVISSLHSWSAAHAFSVACLHRSGELEGRGAGKLGTFSWSRSWSTGFLRSLTVRPVISVDVKSCSQLHRRDTTSSPSRGTARLCIYGDLRRVQTSLGGSISEGDGCRQRIDISGMS